MTTIELSSEQTDAIDYLLGWPKHIQTLGGYAGTGKTTVIKELKALLPNFAVVAYTGKAAHVLRKKDVVAKTIHSCIYYPDEEVRIIDGKLVTRMAFTLRSEIECSGFIVDESSMVSEDIYSDLLSFGLPIIFVGDHGQLEPVGDKFDLMKNPDVTLETVHRNAGEIAHFAEFIRKGGVPNSWNETGEQVELVDIKDKSLDVLECDQFICAYNKTRVGINKDVRSQKGYPDRTPVVNDRIMCLRNHKIGVFNGMQGTVGLISCGEIDFMADDKVYRVKFLPSQFNNPDRPDFGSKDQRIPFDYCYAITCHKAQGDEWDHVMVLEQKCRKWDHRRWAYTAASRARKKLTWVCN